MPRKKLHKATLTGMIALYKKRDEEQFEEEIQDPF